MSHSDNVPCDWHKIVNLGYLEWMKWAEEQIRKGQKEIQCKECGLWLFESELGKKK